MKTSRTLIHNFLKCINDDEQSDCIHFWAFSYLILYCYVKNSWNGSRSVCVSKQPPDAYSNMDAVIRLQNYSISTTSSICSRIYQHRYISLKQQPFMIYYFNRHMHNYHICQSSYAYLLYMRTEICYVNRNIRYISIGILFFLYQHT